MGFSFNKGKEMVKVLIDAKRIKPWSLTDEQLVNFFKIDKTTEDSANKGILAIDKKIKELPDDSAEFYIGNLICGYAINTPTKVGAGLVRKERLFVSEDQKAHYALSRRANKEIDKFIEDNATCQALAGLGREVTVKGKVKKIFIEPKLHMRGSEAVMDSYENGNEEVPVSAPQPNQEPQNDPAPPPVAQS